MSELGMVQRNGQGVARQADRSGLVGFDPFDLFRNFYSASVPPASHLGSVDIVRTESGYTVEIPVPGFKSDQLDITFKDGVLSISGKTERRTFNRSLLIPENCDPEAIEAHVEDGMLTLSLRQYPEAEPKRISVKTK